MLENIQYQNQMIKPVPPQAATYRRISHTQSTSGLLADHRIPKPRTAVATNLPSMLSRVSKLLMVVSTP
jgi:hypothetical protein